MNKDKLLQDVVNRLHWMNRYMEKLTGSDSLHTQTLLHEAKLLGILPQPEMRFGYVTLAGSGLDVYSGSPATATPPAPSAQAPTA